MNQADISLPMHAHPSLSLPHTLSKLLPAVAKVTVLPPVQQWPEPAFWDARMHRQQPSLTIPGLKTMGQLCLGCFFGGRSSASSTGAAAEWDGLAESVGVLTLLDLLQHLLAMITGLEVSKESKETTIMYIYSDNAPRIGEKRKSDVAFFNVQLFPSEPAQCECIAMRALESHDAFLSQP